MVRKIGISSANYQLPPVSKQPEYDVNISLPTLNEVENIGGPEALTPEILGVFSVKLTQILVRVWELE